MRLDLTRTAVDSKKTDNLSLSRPFAVALLRWEEAGTVFGEPQQRHAYVPRNESRYSGNLLTLAAGSEGFDLELFQTDSSGLEVANGFFNPSAKLDSKK